MSEPSGEEVRRAKVVQKAASKGYRLDTHWLYYLREHGEDVMGPVESLDTIEEFLDRQPPRQP